MEMTAIAARIFTLFIPTFFRLSALKGASANPRPLFGVRRLCPAMSRIERMPAFVQRTGVLENQSGHDEDQQTVELEGNHEPEAFSNDGNTMSPDRTYLYTL